MSGWGVRLKVFIFIFIVFASLTFANYYLFYNVITKIQLQQNYESSFNLFKEHAKNHQFELIKKAFNISSEMTYHFDKKKKKISFSFSKVDIKTNFVVADATGKIVLGSFASFNNLTGIPAFERALKKGVATDGFLKTDKNVFLMGAVPKTIDLGRHGKKNFVVFVFEDFNVALKEINWAFPVKVFLDKRNLFTSKPQEWMKVANLTQKLNLSKIQGTESLNEWIRLGSFSFPFDVKEGHKISFVYIVNLLPGITSLSKIKLFLGIYGAIAIFISFFFSLLLTFEINRLFRNIAGDISKLKIGEKMVARKYSLGTGLVVSAVNHLISKYGRQEHTNPGVFMDSLLGKSLEKEEEEVPASKDNKKTGDSIEIVPEQASSYSPIAQEEEDDNEKTQIAASPAFLNKNENKNENVDKFEKLWSDYKAIKLENGKSVSLQEKENFIKKIKANRISIMNKYNCKDVDFYIENKNGKPSIKAKPVKD